MRSRRLSKLLLGVLPAILLAGLGAVIYAATAPSGTDYTVTFNAGTGKFTFSDNVAVKEADGARYPDLFQIEAAMPGDRYDWTVHVKVKNAGADTVKLYVTAGDYNADYAALLGNGALHTPTLTARFDPTAESVSLWTRLLDERHESSAARVASFEQHVGVDEYGVYLGAYSRKKTSREISLSFSLPVEAGNEFADLDAWVHWVFTAEVIPDEPIPARPASEGTDKVISGSDHSFYRVSDLIQMLQNGQTLRLDSLTVTPDMLGTPWAFNTDDHFAYIIGVPEGEVRPNGLITRGEVVTILFRCLREELRDYWWHTANAFTDVPSNLWCNNAISTMARAGVIKGRPDGTFGPNDPITRGEFCTMIGRFYAVLQTNALDFSDIRGHWAEEMIRSVSAHRIVEGYADGTFRPDISITRAEVVAIVNRVLNRQPALRGLTPYMLEWPDNMDTTAWYYLDMQEATNSHDFARTSEYELWTQWTPPPDWVTLETVWADKNTNRNVRIHKSTDGGNGG